VATFTTRDGVRLHYDVQGEGPPLLLHLGAGCDAELWRAAGYVGPLSASRSCILFDHRGHGASDHLRGAAANHIDRYADDVIALIHHLGLESVCYFGWSTGVLVGVRAAEQHPGTFGSLILFGPIAPPATAEQLEARAKQRIAALRERGWWLLLDDMLPAEKLPVPRWMIDRILATDIEPFIGWSQARPAWDWSPWDALPRLDTPTLMLAGELEDPEDSVGRAASLMPSARRVVIAGREHINAFLASELVVPIVTEFLNAQGGMAAPTGG
jgi:pimeloyl-ACP methyl ester carboxylesterase